LSDIVSRIGDPGHADKGTPPRLQTRATAAPDDRNPPASVTREGLAQLAHELRTPLAAIVALAETMTDGHLGPLPNERYRGYVRDIRESARHAIALIAGMAERNSQDEADLDLVFAEVDLNETAASCVSAMQPLADKAGLQLITTLAERLPRLVADGRCLKQILLNLLSNCSKHATRGTKVEVRTGYDIAGPLWLEVADDGPGIPDDVIARTLRASEATPAHSGLGLALSRRLAEANGGRMEIGMRDGGGARVRICFNKDRAVPV
jgi:signal transduction histidine kinase